MLCWMATAVSETDPLSSVPKISHLNEEKQKHICSQCRVKDFQALEKGKQLRVEKKSGRIQTCNSQPAQQISDIYNKFIPMCVKHIIKLVQL